MVFRRRCPFRLALGYLRSSSAELFQPPFLRYIYISVPAYRGIYSSTLWNISRYRGKKFNNAIRTNNFNDFHSFREVKPWK